MTIAVQSTEVEFLGNGSATVFPLPYKVFEAEHLIVTRVTVAGGAELVLNAGQYSVAGLGVEGGASVTIAPALTSAYRVRIERLLPYTQETDISNQGAFLAPVVEDQFDTTTMQIQQLAEDVDDLNDRVDDVEDGLAVETAARVAADTAETAARIEADSLEASIRAAADIALADMMGGGDAPDATTNIHFSTRAAVLVSTIEPGQTYLQTSGYAAPGDYGGALYKKVVSEPTHAGKVQSADGAWWEIAETIFTPEMFGGGVAKTGLENYQAIIDTMGVIGVNQSASAGAAGGTLEFGYGTYQISDTIHVKNFMVFRGKGGGASADQSHPTVLNFAANKHGFVFHRFDTFGETCTNGAWATGATYTAGQARHVVGSSTVIGRIYTLTIAGPGVTSVLPTHTSGTVTGADGYAWLWAATAGGGDGSTIENIALAGSYVPGNTVGHAIWLRSRIYASNVYIRDFAGNGYNIVASAAGAVGPLRGNANNFRIYGGRVIRCNHGCFVDGSDANAGTIFGADFSANRGWGLWEDSFLGNVHIGIHTNSNGTGAERQYNRFVYICVNGALGATTTPGTNPAVWWQSGVIGGGDATATRGDWASGSTYLLNNIVNGLGAGLGVYKCTAVGGGTSTNQPVHASGTVAYADGYSWKVTIVNWISGTTYIAGAIGTGSLVMATNGGTYRCSVVGGGTSINEPSHAAGDLAYADGYSWTLQNTSVIWFSGDTTIVEGGCFKMNDGFPILFGCYAEAGQPAVVAGEAIAMFPGFGRDNLVPGSTGTLWNQEGISKFRVRKLASDGQLLTHDMQWETDALWSLMHPTLSVSARRTSLDFPNGGLTTRYGNSDVLRTELDTLNGTTVKFGRTSNVPHAKFIDRLFIGLHNAAAVGNGRRLSYGTAVPTTGEWARGDLILNHTPSVGSPAGWMCVTSGTAGAGAAFAAMANLV